MNLSTLFLLFMLYSFLGWLMELIVCFIHQKKFTDRGFLIGPYCPIYGVASILMIGLLNKYQNDPLTLFIMAILVTTIIEYLTSYLMEKIFNARWWDYSHIPFNLNGRICLKNSICFGFLGFLLIYVINPFFTKILVNIPSLITTIIAIIIMLLFIIDMVISFRTIYLLRKNASLVLGDYTQEISKKVLETLKKNGILFKRLLNAFPNVKYFKIKNNNDDE